MKTLLTFSVFSVLVKASLLLVCDDTTVGQIYSNCLLPTIDFMQSDNTSVHACKKLYDDAAKCVDTIPNKYKCGNSSTVKWYENANDGTRIRALGHHTCTHINETRSSLRCPNQNFTAFKLCAEKAGDMTNLCMRMTAAAECTRELYRTCSLSIREVMEKTLYLERNPDCKVDLDSLGCNENNVLEKYHACILPVATFLGSVDKTTEISQKLIANCISTYGVEIKCLENLYPTCGNDSTARWLRYSSDPKRLAKYADLMCNHLNDVLEAAECIKPHSLDFGKCNERARDLSDFCERTNGLSACLTNAYSDCSTSIRDFEKKLDDTKRNPSCKSGGSKKDVPVISFAATFVLSAFYIFRKANYDFDLVL